MSDDWAPGDLAECIDDDWREMDGAPLDARGLGLPIIGSVHMVKGVSIVGMRDGKPAVVLRLVGQCVDWLEAIAFRKVPPRYEEPRVKAREEVPA